MAQGFFMGVSIKFLGVFQECFKKVNLVILCCIAVMAATRAEWGLDNVFLQILPQTFSNFESYTSLIESFGILKYNILENVLLSGERINLFYITGCLLARLESKRKKNRFDLVLLQFSEFFFVFSDFFAQWNTFSFFLI